MSFTMQGSMGRSIGKGKMTYHAKQRTDRIRGGTPSPHVDVVPRLT